MEDIDLERLPGADLSIELCVKLADAGRDFETVGNVLREIGAVANYDPGDGLRTGDIDDAQGEYLAVFGHRHRVMEGLEASLWLWGFL